MKKLMFVAAVALCATVPCKAIESANVVGYLDYNLSRGFNFFSPVFEKVDGSDLMLSDISMQDAGSLQSYIQIVTSAGALGDAYYWASAVDAETSEDCWFNQDAWEPVEFALADGQGFYLYAATTTAKAKVNGQVRDDVFSVSLARGFNCVGNSTPVDLDIQDMALANAGSLQSYIQVVTTAGALGSVYYWASAVDAETENDCWFDQDAWAPIDGVTYSAGEGFYLYCATTTGTLELPSAL